LDILSGEETQVAELVERYEMPSKLTFCERKGRKKSYARKSVCFTAKQYSYRELFHENIEV
jgi:hypothetical protein